jgi:hypothetical protein
VAILSIPRFGHSDQQELTHCFTSNWHLSKVNLNTVLTENSASIVGSWRRRFLSSCRDFSGSFSARRPKALVLTNFLPFPAHSGNAARILSMIRALEVNGFDVSILYIRQSRLSSARARYQFGDRFVEVIDEWSRFSDFSSSLSKKMLLDQRYIISDLADMAAPELIDAIRNAVGSFDLVLANYFFLAPILKIFDSALLRIVDTHDVFANRRERLRENGIVERWFTTSQEIERKALEFADRVIAIEPEEAIHFKGLCATPVSCVGYFDVDSKFQRWNGKTLQVSFVGGNSPTNYAAVDFLKNQVCPLLSNAKSNIEIHTYGSVIDKCAGGPIRAHGRCRNLSEFSKNSLASINPVFAGSGMNVKAITSIANGLPVITSKHGSRGIDDYLKVFPQFEATSAAEFAQAISNLPTDRADVNELRQKVRQFYEAFEEKQLFEFSKILNSSIDRTTTVLTSN